MSPEKEKMLLEHINSCIDATNKTSHIIKELIDEEEIDQLSAIANAITINKVVLRLLVENRAIDIIKLGIECMAIDLEGRSEESEVTLQ